MVFITNFFRQLRLKAESILFFRTSSAYWETRYISGGNSGRGSFGKLGRFKADVINSFLSENGVNSVIEFGCGDGNQLKLANYPHYLGFDISEAAVSLCRRLFEHDPTKSFKPMSQYSGEKADCALSLDVIYHIVEDEVYEDYMRKLFGAAERYVIIYSSDFEEAVGWLKIYGRHIRHRKFTKWIERHAPQWRLIEDIPNKYPGNDNNAGSFCRFFIYRKMS